MKPLEDLAREADIQPPEFYTGDPNDTVPWVASTSDLARFRSLCRAEAMEEAAQDKTDAERYRLLRQYGNGIYIEVFDPEADILDLVPASARLDAAVDATIREAAKEQSNG